ncbi:hypothetical protein [Rhodococcus sp. A14]|uniref:hypothetical protein n=1 Tax=Rhodococcus sp. A14 TaxID=1194106 RepID=UPI00197CF7A8
MSTSQHFDQPSPTVRYEVRGGAAVIRLTNPPVNGLGDTVRAGLAAAVGRAAADDQVHAVIPVSYTHLRAHETLKKKNKKEKQQQYLIEKASERMHI